MTYSKPEITVLGDANRVIQGGKLGTPNETNGHPRKITSEIED